MTCDEAALEEQLLKLQGFQENFVVSPVDAYISEYTPENGFQIVPETEGNELNYERTLEAVRAAVDSLTEELDLDEAGCYRSPQVTADDARLLNALNKAQKYTGVTITYTFGKNTEIWMAPPSPAGLDSMASRPGLTRRRWRNMSPPSARSMIPSSAPGHFRPATEKKSRSIRAITAGG